MTVLVGCAENRGRGRRAIAVLVGITTVAAGAAACSDSDAVAGKDAVRLTVKPLQQDGAVAPDTPITVQAENGTVENVTVQARGSAVAGGLDQARTRWTSRWGLVPATDYTVTATGLGRDGRTETVTGRFRTAKVKRTVAANVEAPSPKETVGVGMPIILRFDRPVTNRAAVERAMELHSTKPVEGAWSWFGDQSVVFRTRKFWPAHTKVNLVAHLSGVRAAKGTWGKDFTLDFRIGDSHISKGSAKSHMMTVRTNGRKARTIPVSMGMGGSTKYTTTNGVHLTMEKSNPVIMDSATTGCGPGCPGYYRETVYSAVRISNSGEYVHSAPWSVGSQGNSNVSHGCVNASPSNARWFYNLAYRGDPVIITGTSRDLEPENGWGYWQKSWKDWLKDGATHQTLKIANGDAAPA
ncbi:L,D-transpeptidase family protein [Actinomadura sp. PM05-2]|uniref:L,D-transpeptidase family protein n=2 Tax=Actinomadura parmotrematis TaxID=2864039 RepID=A0ABS7FKG1_9ACTN|nr:L,D-transpeptidase family protein [Actinomadura parmotrematis]